MGSLARICCLGVLLVVAVVARPSAEVSRDARGQSITDPSDPPAKPRNLPIGLNEAYKGGIIPVALLYDQAEGEDEKRALRDTTEDGNSEERDEKNKVVEDNESNSEESEQDKDTTEVSATQTPIQQETKGINKNSKLLDILTRENDENAKYGLGIQSRNKVPADLEEDMGDLAKPFVYNIQPLSFYSSESNTKEEESIINYINKIKEIRENQIKIETAKKEENTPVVDNTEEAVVTEVESDEDRPIRRKIQHYETVIKPMMMEPQVYTGIPQGYPQVYGGIPQGYTQGYPQGYPVYPASTQGLYPQPYQNYFPPNLYQSPQSSTVVYLPNPFRTQNSDKANGKTQNTRLFDDYFPILVNNPFNEIWAGITNIIEYGPEADVCRKNKKGRVTEDEVTTEIELPEQRVGLLGSKGENWPKFTRLKVRRGGVAIAGPGGIATAGSGGTAIVGPGGTAYTTKEGTAVVGPGGRVVHVPQFPIYAKDISEGNESREFVPPPGSETVAHGPVVYYDNPFEGSEMPDPVFPA